jgi:Fic family protein
MDTDLIPFTSMVWKPIDDLPGNWETLGDKDVSAVLNAWKSRAVDMRQDESYKRFLTKLRRQWAIETGYIERLYSLSEGVTKTLIEKGLDAALLSHEDTGQPADDVIALIKDQQTAIEGLYNFIGGERPLGKSYLFQLHATLTAHQKTYEGKDTLGQRVVRDLPHGIFKTQKNNVESSDGSVFEFCPPEHVDMEIEHLLAMHREHERMNVPPDVEAAWLHHRFTLIHPFTDGNGRMSRCLATLVFLKSEWFPLVITRRERADYISALRTADGGDLGALVKLFDELQIRSAREAMSLSEEVAEEVAQVTDILGAVKSKFRARRDALNQQKRRVLITADVLAKAAERRLSEVAAEINSAIKNEGENFHAFHAFSPRTDSRAGYNSHQIIQCAKALGYYANRNTYQAWCSLGIVTDSRTDLLFAFHGIGGESNGVLVCAAMAYMRQTTDEEGTVISEVTPLSSEPFYFTYSQNEQDVAHNFRKWIDQRLIEGLNYWRKAVDA